MLLRWIQRCLRPIDGEARIADADPGLLVCEFRGLIRKGSYGNSQVRFIALTIDRARTSENVHSLILDLSEVRYTFGDHIISLMWNLKSKFRTCALVVSPKSEQLGPIATQFGWSLFREQSDATAAMALHRSATGQV